ncbi:porin [Duncaniella muris]|uniref:porin n=1 Tax=Duncaniella muris TaxID=2094150 RepID=UPI00272D50E9|nr:porin [Duncaniella muris]
MKLHIRHLCLPLAIVAFLASFQKSLAAENQQSGTQPQSDEVSKDKVNLVPKIHGTVRARWEMDTKGGENRFAVRNARVSISGEIAQPIDYYIQTDFCDQGKMKILDAWGRVSFTKRLRLQGGQFRLPFGTDCFRGPGTYFFSNHSFIGGIMNNVRGVGAKLSYTFPTSGSSLLSLEAGAFNPTSMADHNVWVKEMAFAGKALWTIGEVKIAAGAETLIPDSVRINSLTGSVTWTHGGLTLEGEYLNKHYTNNAHKAAHGYNVFADYGFPVKAGIFNRASVQARFDGMTAYSSGNRNDEGKLFTDYAARNRVTVGGTLSYIYKFVRCDLRLSYEKYFYHHDAVVAVGEGDKVCAELVVKF